MKKGVVISKGPGKFIKKTERYNEIDLEKNDVIIFDESKGKKVTYNLKEFILLDAEDCIAKVGEVLDNGSIKLYGDIPEF